MYQFPEYIHAIHAERLREAEAARRANAMFSRRERRPLGWHRFKRSSRSRAANPA